MKIRNWLLTERGVVWTSIILTIIVLLESRIAPWSPYFIVYAAMAIAIPIVLKTYRFGSFRDAMRKYWKIFIAILVLGVFFLAVGLFDVCVLAPLFGRPFTGKRIRAHSA